MKRLPPSYGTIHVLWSETPELLTAVKSGVITKTLSIRSATTYVKQIRTTPSAVMWRRVAGASIREPLQRCPHCGTALEGETPRPGEGN